MLKKLWLQLPAYLLYLFCFILPLQTHYLLQDGMLNNQYWAFGNISLYGVDILLLILIILWRPKINRHFRWPLIILIILSALSIGQAINHSLALYATIRLTLAICLFAIIVTGKFNRQRLIDFIIATAMIQAVWGIGQFFTQTTFADKWLGVAVNNAHELGTSVIETVGPDGQGERWLRAYGGLPHPNILGAFLALALILTIGSIKKEKAFITRADSNRSRKDTNLFYYSALIITSAGLFFTFSRSAILAALVGLLVVLWPRRTTNFRLPIDKIIAIFLIIVTVLVCAWRYGYIYRPRLYGQTRLEIISDRQRADLIKDSLILIKSRPALGHGQANFGLAIFQVNNKLSVFDYQPVHNLFLLIAAEIGLPGLLIMLYLLWLIIRRTDHPALATYLLCLAMFDHYFWTQVFGIYLFWLILSLVATTDN